MTELIINEVYPKASVNPILINFQNGYINEEFETSQCQLFSNTYSQNKTVITMLNNLLYTSEEQEADVVNNVLLVRDKITGKVRIIETTNAELKPIVNTNLDTTLHETSNLELSRKFGSKKQKRHLEQKEKLKSNTDTVKQQMKNVTENTKIENLDMSLYTKTDSEDLYVPPIDREATKVEDVYRIDKILTEEQYEKIYSEIESKDLMSNLVPIVKDLVNGKSLSEKHKVLSLYASTLLKLYASQSKEFSRKLFVVCDLSHTLNEYILSNFTLMSNNRRTRPNPLKDKALCHAIVLMLILNDFKLPLDELAKAAKVTPNTAITKVRAVGAHITYGDNKMIQLKVPLNVLTGFKRRKSAKF